jgi:dolichol-phosphate mannosyltransferase
MSAEGIIIIPTYNEENNIIDFLHTVHEHAPDLDILVVDDNSSDHTKELVLSLATKLQKLKLLVREKNRGYGRALLEAYNYAIKNNYKFILQMDADFSHNPEYIPDFLKEKNDYDIIIGSRYTPGGEIKNWSKLRKIISRAGNIFARKVLHLPVMDCTSGFRLLSNNTISMLCMQDFYTDGYAFLIETLFKIHRAGCRIKEIPIAFIERRADRSKFSIKIFLEAFYTTLKLMIK